MWYVDQLLGNDSEITNYTTALLVSGRKQQQRKDISCAVRADVISSTS
jgi:hypothetical protein